MKQVIKASRSNRARSRSSIEEFFGEFGRKKHATEIVERLKDREHLIHMIEAPLDDEPNQVVPVAFKVGHEIRGDESIPKLADLVRRLDGSVQFEGRKVLHCAWIGGTRRDWRGKGFLPRAQRRAGSLGLRETASTKSSSRRRTSSTKCEARWTTCASRW